MVYQKIRERKYMRCLAIVLVFVLAGCTTIETVEISDSNVVYLSNEEGNKAQCGPYEKNGPESQKAIAASLMKYCLLDHKRIGYRETSGP